MIIFLYFLIFLNFVISAIILYFLRGASGSLLDFMRSVVKRFKLEEEMWEMLIKQKKEKK